MDNVAVVLIGGCLLAAAFLAGFLWVRTLAPRLKPVDHVALSMGMSTVALAAIGITAYAAPWSFRMHSTIGVALYVAGALWFGARAMPAWLRDLRGTPFLWLPFVLSACMAVGFTQIQGDPDATVSWPGTFYSARVAKLPADHYLPFRGAQFAQYRLPLDELFFLDWDFSDRTPVAGLVAASTASAAGVDFGVELPWLLPPQDQLPQPMDPIGFWFWRLVGSLLNSSIVLGMARFALSIFDRRAALVAGLLGAISPYVLTHEIYMWPKMLAAYFLLLHFTFVREGRQPVLTGALAGLAFLSHPLSALFVIGSMMVLLRRHSYRAVAAAGLLVLPWQLWMTVASHPSRMITYPLGITVMDEQHFGDEIRRGFDHFWESGGFAHAFRIRGEIVLHSLVPVDLDASCAECTTRFSRWFIIHDRVLTGIVLFTLLPAVVLGLKRWLTKTPGDAWWVLVMPFLACVAFWGITNVALGADVFQPLGATLIAVSAGGLVAFSRRVRLVFAFLALLEAASVVWAGLFAPLPDAKPIEVVAVVSAWAVLAGVLLVALGVERSAPAHLADEVVPRPPTREVGS